MASNPHLFQVEDNTDEDFFDKLVNDDDDVDFKVTAGAPVSSLPSDGNESDEIKGFEDLRIGELDNSHDNAGGSTDFHLDNLGTSKKVEQTNEPGIEEKNGDPLASVNSLESNSLETEGGVPKVLSSVTFFTETNNEGLSGMSKSGDDPSLAAVEIGSSGESFSEMTVMNMSSGDSESIGAKQVGWGMFNAEAVGNDKAGFGSYSNFFSELAGNGNDKVQNVVGNNFNNEPHVSMWNDEHGSESVANSNSMEQTAAAQDFNSIQYWENQYPGWKYDPSSGEWYQVDVYESRGSVQADVDDNANVSYMQQVVQSVAVAETETGTTGNVMNWNQASRGSDAAEATTNLNEIPQGSSSTTAAPLDWSQAAQGYAGYPPHMVFDPQYPGWYYDTITQEWCSLEAYAASIQSGSQVQDQIFDDQKTYDTHSQGDAYQTENFGNIVQDQRWIQPVSNYDQMNSSIWQPNTVTSVETTSWNPGNQLIEDHSGHYSHTSAQNHQYYNDSRTKNSNIHSANDYFVSQNSSNFSKKYTENAQIPYAPAAEQLSAGRPAHALVAFGFGGKLIVLKDNGSPANSYFTNQNHVGSSISVLNLSEVLNHNGDASDRGLGVCGYFKAVHQHCVPGPLSGGSVGTRELNKWIDERIEDSNSVDVDYRRSEVLKLLLKLLKIACQYYGKFRSPYGTDVSLKESDAPESAVAKLFASAGRNGSQFHQYDMVAQCLQQIPSEGQMQITAAEVQRLLVSGRKKEALQCAQEGQLWGPAIVLAAQLGDQFYAETVKQMALCQFVAGSPLRTLCLLISGQPADVFAVDNTAISSMTGSVNMPQKPAQFASNGMLDDWAENLAVITANRTKDDELVLMHLGDCLWRERSDIIAAHICYLVAEANFEPYSDTARMCLIGADHWKFPRTYASPEAIQRTEIYEYSKTLGNSQFVLLPFQPYKYIYANMLAEVGKLSDALKYCQAILKSLKTGRTPEADTLRHLVSSFEERIKSHQQGGFSANLAPKKIVGALLNLLDSTAHRVVGGAPPIPSEGGSARLNDNPQSLGPRVSTSQSTLAMSSLVPSQSFEPINDWGADSNKMAMYSRSVSEPDFGRSPGKDNLDSLKEASSAGVHDKASTTGGTSRFGRFRFGSQLLQKTVGLVLRPRQGHQAKLGETNKFYYDEKLKRWVEEGAETPAEEAVLPPPPTTSVLQNGPSNYNLKSALGNEPSYSSRIPESISSTTLDSNSGMPPLPPMSNQYSARGRMSVRSRYVDTFNKGGGQAANLFQSPSTPVKPAVSGANPKFFVPAPVSAAEQQTDAAANGPQDSGENPPTSSLTDSFTMQRFASMDNIKDGGSNNGSFSFQSRRTASWSGSLNDPSVTPHSVEAKRAFGTPPSQFMPRQPVLMNSSIEGGNSGDELQEVQL